MSLGVAIESFLEAHGIPRHASSLMMLRLTRAAPSLTTRYQSGGMPKASRVVAKEYVIDLKGPGPKGRMYFRTEVEPTNDNKIALVSIDDHKICGVIVIEKDVAILDNVNASTGCVSRVKDETLVDADEVGTLIVQIMLEYCKMKGVQTVKLVDGSEFFCTLAYRVELPIAHVLTHGEPWYYKFGFRYDNPIDRRAAEENKKKWKRAMLRDLDVHQLLQELRKRVTDMETHLAANGVRLDRDTASIRAKHAEMTASGQHVGDFFKWFQRSHCVLFAFIYRWSFDKLGFSAPYTKDMSLALRARIIPATRE